MPIAPEEAWASLPLHGEADMHGQINAGELLDRGDRRAHLLAARCGRSRSGRVVAELINGFADVIHGAPWRSPSAAENDEAPVFVVRGFVENCRSDRLFGRFLGDALSGLALGVRRRRRQFPR